MKPKQRERYEHYKSKNMRYEIVTVSKVNGKQFVFYTSLYSDEHVYFGQPFSRPLEEFCGYKVFDKDYTNYDGKEFKKGEKVKRYTLLEDKINN